MGEKFFLPRAGALLLLPVLLLAACAGDEARERVLPVEDATVTFSVNVPGNSPAATRGLSERDETNVETIDVLLFRREGNLRVYYDRVLGVSVDNSPGNTKSFRAVIPVKEYANFDISIIANARDVILNSGLAAGEEKNTILDKLIKEVPVGQKWNSDRIPMWGESLNVDIDENTNLSGNDAVSLSRMVSRIDVKLSRKAATGSDDPESTGNGNFELTSVRLYNYSTRGTVAPDLVSGWYPGDATTPPAATAPNMPSGGYAAALYPNVEPLVYTAADEHSGDGFMPDSLIRAIYTLESSAGSPSSLETNTCVVIGGKYRGGSETFYRVDIAKKNGTNQYEYLPLKRNFLYSINITHITGEGYTDPDEAFHSRPVNIEAVITEWNEGDMDETDFNGQNRLTVSKSTFFFYDDGRPQTIRIFTDHPRGWRVDQSTVPSWLTVSPDSDDSGETVSVTIEPGHISGFAPEVPPGDTLRYSFWILAGNIRKEITIEQVNEPEYTIDVSPSQLVFRKSGSIPKSVTVTVYPETSIVYFSTTQGSNPISWVPLTGFPETGLPNITSYWFQPELNDSGSLMSSLVSVYIEDAQGNMISKTLTISQLATDLLFEVYDISDPYPSEGGAATFRINSETDWNFYDVDEPEGQSRMISNFDSEVYPAATAKLYSFTLTPNETWGYRYATLKPGSSSEDFAGQGVEIRQGYATPSLALSSGSLDFGNTTSTVAKNIEVTSNSEWSFIPGENWSAVVATPAVGGTQGTHSYNETNAISLAFTPAPYDEGAGLPKAGQVYNTTATFRTTNHDNAPEQSKTLELFRTVPPRFSYLSFNRTNGDFSPKNVTVTANTNASFQARVIGAVTTTGTAVEASAYGSKTASVTVPINNSWNTATTNIYYVYNGSQSASLGTVTQTAGYSISSSANVLSNTGGISKVTVTLTGRWPNEINVRAATGGTAASNRVAISGASSKVGAQTTSSMTSLTSGEVTVGMNTTGAPKKIYIQYQHPNNGWTDVDSFEQPKGNTILTVPPYRVVALEDAKYNGTTGSASMDWARAMGISPTYNTNSYRWVTEYDYTVGYGVGFGGCADYFEEGYPAGTWKLPQLDEMKDMRNQGELPLDDITVHYHYNNQYSTPNVLHFVPFGNGPSGYYSKTSSAYVRCVRSQ